MTWNELAIKLRRLPDCDHARLQGTYPEHEDIWATAPATIAVYLIPFGASHMVRNNRAWQLHVTAIEMGGRARCNLLAEFWRDDAAAVALMTATKAIYPEEGQP